MSTVIGLFQPGQMVDSSMAKLQQAGCTADKIRILTRYDEVAQIFSSTERRLVVKYVVWGALLGIAVLNLYGLIMGGYACSRFLGYIPVSYWLCDLVGFSIIGLILGAFAGLFVGFNKFEKEADLYTHGISEGGTLITVQVEDEPATGQIINILRQANAQGVKAFQDLAETGPG